MKNDKLVYSFSSNMSDKELESMYVIANDDFSREATPSYFRWKYQNCEIVSMYPRRIAFKLRPCDAYTRDVLYLKNML